MRHYLAKRFFGAGVNLTSTALILFDVWWMAFIYAVGVLVLSYSKNEGAYPWVILIGHIGILIFNFLRFTVQVGFQTRYLPNIEDALCMYRKNFFMKTWLRVFFCMSALFVMLPFTCPPMEEAIGFFWLLLYPVPSTVCAFIVFGALLAALHPKSTNAL